MLITCDQCSASFSFPDQAEGREVECPRCTATFVARRTVVPVVHEPEMQECRGCGRYYPLDVSLVTFDDARVRCTHCGYVSWIQVIEDDELEVEADRRERISEQGRLFSGAPPGEEPSPLMLGDPFASNKPPPSARVVPVPAPAPPLRSEPMIQSLYEQVWAAPDDDGPRSVLADHLTELGDPRGEFIAIQLANPDGRLKGLARGRARELERHYHEWIPPGVDRQSAVFHRGFLRACHWIKPTDPSHREWRTVERLDCTAAVSFPRGTLFAQNALPHLKEIRGADSSAFLALCSSDSRARLEVLHTFHLSFAHEGQFAVLASFPALHTLDFQGTKLADDTLAHLCRSVGPEVKRLRVDDLITDEYRGSGRLLHLVAAREALRPGQTLTIHIDRQRLCWFELFGGEVRLCHRASASADMRGQLIEIARREGLRAVLVPVDEPA